jgi:hypothetical protein
MKPGRMRLIGHLTCMKEKINAHWVLVRKYKGKR